MTKKELEKIKEWVIWNTGSGSVMKGHIYIVSEELLKYLQTLTKKGEK